MNKITAEFLANLYNQTFAEITPTEIFVRRSVRTSVKPCQVEIDGKSISSPITTTRETYGLIIARKH